MDALQRQPRKNLGKDSKRTAVELWRAGVHLAAIKKQLKMSESTLRRILTLPTLLVPPGKPVSGRPRKISQETM